MQPRRGLEEEFESPSESTDRGTPFGLGRGVLVRMVVGQGLIGLLLLTASLVSIWQLNNYNSARREWMKTQDRLSLISNVGQDSKVLVLVTHRIAFTQSPFPPGSEIIRDPCDSIALSANPFTLIGDQLEQEAASLPEDNPIRIHLVRSVGLTNELINMAYATLDLCREREWTAAQELVSRTSETSLVPRFDRVHTDLIKELGQAIVLTQEDSVTAQEQMDAAGRTAIWVTVSVAVTVVGLAVVLSLNTIRSITDPINELSSAASQLKRREFGVRVPATRKDEFGHLARVFNEMAAELGRIYAGMNQELREMREREEVRIVLDEARQKEQVEEITGADYFKRIHKRAAEIRRTMNQE